MPRELVAASAWSRWALASAKSSGWAALNLKDGALEVASYHDADTPVAHGATPLLMIDVWEHAYYIDHRNARPDYVEAVLHKALNWDFAARNLDGEGVSRADQRANVMA